MDNGKSLLMTILKGSRLVVIGVLIGVSIALPIVTISFGLFKDAFYISVFQIISTIFGLSILLFFVSLFGPLIAKKITNKASLTLESIASEFNELFWKIIQSKYDEAENISDTIVTRFALLWSVTTFNRWAVGSIIAIILILAGSLGSILLVRQNDLIEQQTVMINKQLHFLANSEKYRYINLLYEKDKIIPEGARTQALRYLLDNAKTAEDYSCNNNNLRLNLSGANLSGIEAERLNLSCIDFSGANFSGANLKGASLRNSNLIGTKFDSLPISIITSSFDESDIEELIDDSLVTRNEVKEFLRKIKNQAVNQYALSSNLRYGTTDLSCADFTDARIEDATFMNINGIGAIFNTYDLPTPKNWHRITYPGTFNVLWFNKNQFKNAMLMSAYFRDGFQEYVKKSYGYTKFNGSFSQNVLSILGKGSLENKMNFGHLIDYLMAFNQFQYYAKLESKYEDQLNPYMEDLDKELSREKLCDILLQK